MNLLRKLFDHEYKEMKKFTVLADKIMALDEEYSKFFQIAEVKNYIGELFRGNINWGLVNKQINSYIGKGYKPSGIQGTLHYCYIIKKMNIQKANGIGIVEYYYKQAGEYFNALERMEKVQKVELTTKEIVIKEPVATKLTRLKPIALEDLINE